MEFKTNWKDRVVLVDKNDKEIGIMPKLDAHQTGVLHRAFSIFIFNREGQLLLQQRASGKYHSAGLWSNTCCSHPLPGESVIYAAYRRLQEEMGITCRLKPVFNFIYRAELDNELIEHEYDHVLFGHFDSPPKINSAEVQDWKYMDMEELQEDLKNNPEKYTVWFKLFFDKVNSHPESFKLVMPALNV